MEQDSTVFNLTELLKFGVKQEIQGNYAYGMRVRSERSIIEYFCKHAGCKARFTLNS